MVLLDQVLADPDAALRVCRAGVRVQIDLRDLPDSHVTLLFDEPPARATCDRLSAHPDVRLWMSSADLEAVLRGSGYLPLQILSGAVEFEGHVRKLLRVLPILTAAVAAVPGVADGTPAPADRR